MQPVYKCRLCGKLFYPFGAFWTRDEASENLSYHVFKEKTPTVDTPQMLETHMCHGPNVGDLGIGDLLGYRSVREEG